MLFRTNFVTKITLKFDDLTIVLIMKHTDTSWSKILFNCYDNVDQIIYTEGWTCH
jgi:hypothetical protein